MIEVISKYTLLNVFLNSNKKIKLLTAMHMTFRCLTTQLKFSMVLLNLSSFTKKKLNKNLLNLLHLHLLTAKDIQHE